ncbi:hypothetical protein GCM10023231_02770 [Olivibacter ginsenosidimutans]|uniref:Uncharacterized protein n=1 Tax=Olivibacter ginsenosidimutans TaxID=1176537 RepID=A0ABP9ADS4_9SPHI
MVCRNKQYPESNGKYNEKMDHMNIDEATLSISEDAIKQLLKNMGKGRKTLTRDEINALFRE